VKVSPATRPIALIILRREFYAALFLWRGFFNLGPPTRGNKVEPRPTLANVAIERRLASVVGVMVGIAETLLEEGRIARAAARVKMYWQRGREHRYQICQTCRSAHRRLKNASPEGGTRQSGGFFAPSNQQARSAGLPPALR